ncbi:MAG: VWA domain-containing protein, partial [Bacteroidetes bacterium]|nr:VWA domain-containing protein [Bacteroidota bacterium]
MFKKSFTKGLLILTTLFFVITVVSLTSAMASQVCPMDVVFVIDDTGSMSGAISDVKSGLLSIISSIVTTSGGDYQLGLITFKDTVIVEEDFALSNAAVIQTKISSLTASGGGSGPEASDEALNTAVNCLSTHTGQVGDFNGPWRSGVVKIIIFITDAPPGGFDDQFTVTDQNNATARANEASAAGIKIASIYVPTSFNATVKGIMENYANTTGGVFTQTANNGSGAAEAIEEIIKDCAGESDVYIMDTSTDTGIEPHTTQNVYHSPDIRVCNAQNCTGHHNPVESQTNYVYVTLRNDGPRVQPPKSITGDLYVYYTASGGAAQWSTDWVPIGTESGITLAPGQISEIEIPWNNVPNSGHYCLLARWVSDQDPMAVAEGSQTITNTRNNNNIAWKNVNVVKLSSDNSSQTLDFMARNIEQDAVLMDFEVRIPEPDHSFLQDNDMYLQIDPDTLGDWEEQGFGFEMIKEGLFYITGENAQIENIRVERDADPVIKVTFRLRDPQSPADNFDVHLVQHIKYPESPDERIEVGGVSYQINVNGEESETIILQPDAEDGQDAHLSSLEPNLNLGDHKDLNAVAWTSGGQISNVRNVFQFAGLSVIPQSTQILSAKLSLFNNPTASNGFLNGEHSSYSGSNESVIQRVTSSWDEYSVTWDNQPTTTTQNQVTVPQSTSPHQDYEIDVTDL